ncbi:hypothetical protein SEA_TUNATARTARE_205 [Streptomyces phage TunaTartare]|jgi:hypothetical protein|uniref:Uncharacterized protein n=1 Tax=Streptomyces phage TunaTartare TaxID=2848887 RepID=A0A8F2E6V3_9CAUD|nr:hypothetical protein PP457_gp075 [Streptomyces phage TunaTartare]QWT30067.1 hypothetical protein SEA_TUNATARTARE_205 [Streptomyces phage TunaTartare]
MSNRQPNFAVGDKVKYGNEKGVVEKVWTVNPSKFRYTVKLNGGVSVIEEGDLKRA